MTYTVESNVTDNSSLPTQTITHWLSQIGNFLKAPHINLDFTHFIP